jgi:hypothetical protein
MVPSTALNLLTRIKHRIPILHFVLQQPHQHPNVSIAPEKDPAQMLINPAELLSRSSLVVHSVELV